MRGQLASSASACATAEGRNCQLSSQVSAKIAELTQMREEAEKTASNYKIVSSIGSAYLRVRWPSQRLQVATP